MNLLPHLRKTAQKRNKVDVADCHRHECRVCPMAHEWENLNNPHMEPTGAKQPLAYILGEAPGAREDEKGEQFVGDSGEWLRPLIPRKYRDRVRFNNVIRCRPPKNRNPLFQEIECCRPSIVRDIEQSKPKAILGFGNFPLNWIWPEGSSFEGINLWRGRRCLVKVGSHVCWYYPLFHPSYLLQHRRKTKKGDPIASEEELTSLRDIKRIWKELENLPEGMTVPDTKEVFAGIELIIERQGGIERIRKGFAWAHKQRDIGLDYETDRLRPYRKGARILTIGIANKSGGFVFALDHPDIEWTEKERAEIRAMYVEFLRTYKGRIYVHNLAFELEWTGVYFKDLSLIRACDWHDTMSQASIIDERKGERKPGAFSLEFLVLQYFGFNLKKITQLDKARLAEEPVAVVALYNGGDARYHGMLGSTLRAIIEEENLDEAYILALRRVPTVVLTQIKGAPVDQVVVEELRKKYAGRVAAAEEAIAALPIVKQFRKERGFEYSPSSNPDTLYIFKDMMRCEECEVWDKKKHEVKYSVDKNVLDLIDHPLASLLLEYREAAKRLGTYITPLIDDGEKTSVIYSDGLIHTNFNTVFAETGRLTSDGPNMQNFPKRHEEGKEARKQVVAAPGCLAVALDYGQIEARVIAMFTKDKRFVKALWEDYDVHMEWAERLAYAYPDRIGGKKNLTDKKVMKTFRTDIKNQWTFPLFFGAALGSAAGFLQIPESVLKPEYEEFWRQFSGVKDWQEETIAFYKEHNYVECLTGRRRHGPMTVNQLINAPVQGTAAEIVMDAMCRLSETGNPELQAEINIHDDLTYLRIPEDRSEDICTQIVDTMIHVPFDWAHVVPITVEMSIGRNWCPYDAKTNPEGLKEVGTFRSDKW